jgi:hypothetical protein
MHESRFRFYQGLKDARFKNLQALKVEIIMDSERAIYMSNSEIEIKA